METPKLVSIAGGTAGVALEIASGKFSIGRALQNAYVIEDVLISRHHCAIELVDGQWTILDMSINGTHLNNIIIGKDNRKKLEHGDIIMLTDNVKFKFQMRDTVPEDDFDAVAEAAMDAVDLSATLQAEDIPEASLQHNNEPSGSSSRLEEDDLTCSVCAELFIEAVTLGCSHTFCKFCIEQWRKNSHVCPICRTRIKGQFPTLIINNLVEKCLPQISEEDRTRRNQLIEERHKVKQPFANVVGTPTSSATSSATVSANSTHTIDITTSDDDEDDEDDDDDEDGVDSLFDLDGSVFFLSEDWEDEYDNDDYSDYNGLPGAYYGGYGYCYSCGERGHWANGCPSNPRRRRNH